MRLIPAIVLFTLFSCNNAGKKETMPMPGAYTMLSRTVNDGKKDTTYTNLKELKIYTDDHMMYVVVNPADSVSGFGIGTYSADTGTVVEKLMYRASDTSATSTAAGFFLQIEKTPKGYKQLMPGISSEGKKLKITEEYESVGAAVKSPLDGAWKAINVYAIKGKDTVTTKIAQYKTYYAGNFMFGHTYMDSTNKLHTGMGYGTFEMNGTNKVKESVSASNYYQVRGKSFDIDIEMNGTDEFTQTITNTDGSKDVELYQRLKK